LQTLRFTLKQPNTTFLTATLSKINLIPKHIWEPVLTDLAGKPDTADCHGEDSVA
jgi:peptide/nickel transport system substrate-binding protein